MSPITWSIHYLLGIAEKILKWKMRFPLWLPTEPTWNSNVPEWMPDNPSVSPTQ